MEKLELTNKNCVLEGLTTPIQLPKMILKAVRAEHSFLLLLLDQQSIIIKFQIELLVNKTAYLCIE